MDAFELLGLERRLTLSADEAREAFRAAGRSAHPDAGGTTEDFARLRQAAEVLAEPARRLRHWLELEGVEGSMRGSLSAGVMEWFSEVGAELQEADALIRERDKAASALARALMEGRVQACRGRLEGLQERLEQAEAGRVAAFPEVERGLRDGWELARELAFLAKWRGQVRERFAALW